MKVNEIFSKMKEIAPLELCEDWDNSGLLINMENDVHKVLLVLDVTHETIDRAKRENCEMIISHHPVIFRGIKKMNKRDIVTRLIQNNISVISMHTNLDAADGGVNDALARKLGVVNVEHFTNIGRMGEIKPVMISDFANIISKELNTHVKFVDTQKIVKRVALIGGSAGGYWKDAMKASCDVFITGEASHHDGCDAMAAGMGLIVAGHYSTEVIVLEPLKEKLMKLLPECKFIVEKGKDPYVFTE